MSGISWSIEHLRRLSLAAPLSKVEDPLTRSLIKSILLMIRLIEANVSFHTFSDVQDNGNLVLLRVDLKRKDYVRVFSFLPIVRFLHASERCDYSLYPLYPIDRANVESTIVLMLQAFSASNANMA